MKKVVLLVLTVAVILMSADCSIAKRVKKNKVATQLLPGTELVSGKGLLRGWGVGKSDNEMSARKKAQLAASVELAAVLDKTVKSTTEEYNAVLTEGSVSESKSLMTEKINIVVEQTLKGAVVIFDQWANDKKTGQYANYIVMELKGEQFLDALYNEFEKGGIKNVDRKLLKEIFLKQIENAAKK